VPYLLRRSWAAYLNLSAALTAFLRLAALYAMRKYSDA
jgi:hypothetical protein